MSQDYYQAYKHFLKYSTQVTAKHKESGLKLKNKTKPKKNPTSNVCLLRGYQGGAVETAKALESRWPPPDS